MYYPDRTTQSHVVLVALLFSHLESSAFCCVCGYRAD